MKRSFLTLIFGMFIAMQLSASIKQHISPATGSILNVSPNQVEQSIDYLPDGVSVTYCFPCVTLIKNETTNDVEHILIDGLTLSTEPGFPALPVKTDMFNIPSNYDIKLEVAAAPYIDIHLDTVPVSQFFPIADITPSKIESKEYKGFFPETNV